MPAPEAVLFDFGDTLLHEGPVDMEAGAAAVLALARARAGCTPTVLAEALSEVMDDLEPRRRASLLELPPATIWRLAYEPLGIEFDASPEEIEWAYWHAATTWEPEPDVEVTLATLDRANIPWAVLSNTMFRGRVIERQLALCGLPASHRFVMASAEYVLRKPHPRLFAIAAKRLECPPHSLWFVGDSFEYDVCGAAAAGMVPLWYCPNGTPTATAPAMGVIEHWKEFPDFLAAATTAL